MFNVFYHKIYDKKNVINVIKLKIINRMLFNQKSMKIKMMKKITPPQPPPRHPSHQHESHPSPETHPSP